MVEYKYIYDIYILLYRCLFCNYNTTPWFFKCEIQFINSLHFYGEVVA
jgi:hypothetical protein